MFNPDGSEFERSGNGLRVLGAYLFARGRAREGRPFPVEVGGDRVHMEVLRREPGGLLQVAVEMGRGRAGGAAVGWREEEAGDGGRLRGPGGEGLDAEPFSVGNPHCVVFRGELRDEDLLRLGPHLTRHPAFPEGINVQLARVRGEGRVEILIWERGVGRTSSSGTSACAVAGACVHRGLLEPGRVEVVMEGGSFFVTVSPELELRLEGPVRPIMTGELTDEMLETLRAGPSGPSWRES
jgi:diaminopimelate epimerase